MRLESTRLPFPVNTACDEDNPHLRPDGQVLYFDSNRADPTGSACLDESGMLQRTIYQTRWTNGGWSVPEPVGGAVNETVLRWQVFVTGSQMPSQH